MQLRRGYLLTYVISIVNIGRHINGVIVRELIQFELTGDHPYGPYCSRSISYDSYDMNPMRWSDSNVLKLVNTLGLILNLITMAHSLWLKVYGLF